MSMSSDVMDAESVKFLPRNVVGQFEPYLNKDEIIGEICDRLAKGDSLIKICEAAHMPNRWTVADWIAADEQAAQRVSRARELGEDKIANDALLIADGLLPASNVPNDPQRDKLRIDTRLKLLARFNPKRWGDSTQLRHADADGNKLDTAPLVSELLALLPGGVQPPAPKPAAVTHRVVRESALEEEPKPTTPSAARPAYRPRGWRDDCEDLV